MDNILLIETSNQQSSVGLVSNGSLIELLEVADAMRSSESLVPMVHELLAKKGRNIKELTALAVSAGPGSYTGLRIGASFAKGICYALDLPLIALSSLQIMCAGFLESNTVNPNCILIPMIDARRNEVFTAPYSTTLNPQKNDGAIILDPVIFKEETHGNTVHFFGSGSEKYKAICKMKSAHFSEGDYLSAKFMSKLAHTAFKQKQFVDIKTFEPFYTKAYHLMKKK